MPSNVLTGAGPEPRAIPYGPRLTCPHCTVNREYLAVRRAAELAPGRVFRSPVGWQAVCGNCGEEFSSPPAR